MLIPERAYYKTTDNRHRSTDRTSSDQLATDHLILKVVNKKEELFRIILKIHWSLSTILRTTKKSVRGNVFWYAHVCIFWKFIQNTIHWEKTQTFLKRFPSKKKNGTKNVLFFLSRALTHQSFTFNLRFFLNCIFKVRLSKTVCSGIFHFRIPLVFIKVYILVNKMHELFDFKTSQFLSKLK